MEVLLSGIMNTTSLKPGEAPRFGTEVTPQVMPVSSVGFLLRPDGFFGRNPAIDRPPPSPRSSGLSGVRPALPKFGSPQLPDLMRKLCAVYEK
jgi:hypothetical protein